MRRPTVLAVLLAAALAAGCAAADRAADEREAIWQLRGLVEDTFPLVEVTDVGGLGRGARVHVDFLGPIGSNPEVHRLTRDVARLVWRNAPRHAPVLQVDQTVPLAEDGCADDELGEPRSEDEACLRDSLVVGFDDAARLWGRPAGPAPARSGLTQPCTDLGGDVFGRRAELAGVRGDAPSFVVRPDRSTATPRRLADRAAEHLWACQPQRLPRLVVIVDAGTGPRTEFRYPAAALTGRFGPRPADLRAAPAG